MYTYTHMSTCIYVSTFPGLRPSLSRINQCLLWASSSHELWALPRPQQDSKALAASKIRVVSLWGGQLEVLLGGARLSAEDCCGVQTKGCVCIHIYIYMHISIYIYTYMYTNMCVYIYMYNVHIYVYTYIDTYTYAHVGICLCICVCILPVVVYISTRSEARVEAFVSGMLGMCRFCVARRPV